MKLYIVACLFLVCALQFVASYPYGDESKAKSKKSGDNQENEYGDDQLEVFRDAAKRAFYNFKCATSSCRPRAMEPTLRCCPGMRCKCGILWNAGQCKCTNYGYGR
ncbi:uncharacterized protein LOC135488388 isoform X2 [Lineus longissimus]|uniref:uncharacterized protein LOC135488388 isoform X2 n=1 Tax=Lineus longissimus TaxID=88925 RepID=UPI002B4F1F89